MKRAIGLSQKVVHCRKKERILPFLCYKVLKLYFRQSIPSCKFIAFFIFVLYGAGVIF